MTNSENPFVLLARITVKEGMVDEYLEIAEAADKAVEKTEEGMLFHNFDRDPDDCLLYTSPSPRDKRQSRMPSSA